MVNTFFFEAEIPKDFSWTNMMKEIMLTYCILFRDDRKSRKIYQLRERARARFINGSDSKLDTLCGADWSTSIFASTPVKESYDSEVDFPILSRRLHRLQDYMLSIQPNRVLSVWRDRRDLTRWYTLWAVLIIGGISVVLGIIQLFLSAAQVGIAAESLELQKLQMVRSG
jgi:hypothetical protein